MPEDVVIADIGDQALDIFLHGPESTHKNGIVKTFTHTSIPIQSCTLLKQTKSKTLNSPNMTPSISCSLPVQCCGRRPPESLADALQDWSTSEVFSLGQYWQNIFVDVFNKYNNKKETEKKCVAIMPFLTTSTTTLSCLASAAPHTDSWRLGHVERDGVIADIGGRPDLDIFLHGPECAQEWHCKDIHSHIHSHTPVHTPRRREKMKKKHK